MERIPDYAVVRIQDGSCPIRDMADKLSNNLCGGYNGEHGGVSNSYEGRSTLVPRDHEVA